MHKNRCDSYTNCHLRKEISLLMKMKKLTLTHLFLCALLGQGALFAAEEKLPSSTTLLQKILEEEIHEEGKPLDNPGHTINFQEVPVIEFIKFVSRISEVNFIYDHKELQFNISFASGKPISARQVLKALIHILRVHGLSILDEGGYLVVHKSGGGTGGYAEKKKTAPEVAVVAAPAAEKKREDLSTLVDPFMNLRSNQGEEPQFLVYKLKYHSGAEIEETIKKIAADLSSKPEASHEYVKALHSVQWVKNTNSLFCSGDTQALASVKKLIQSLDVALRQVFIEILVIETDVKRSTDFGLQWAAAGKYKDKLGVGIGNFGPGHNPSPFALAFKGKNPATPPGPGQIPLGRGFDMGVIGDIIMHKGLSYVSLGSLVSALQMDGDSSIVLNQKIITQDNKNSTIFVGENIPFTGSVVTTTGSSQQTSANIEYRNIGVTLSITPRLGDGDVITLDLTEEITEIIPTNHDFVASNQVNGIQTTKTNMMTHVHVPDNHFLVLSGMIRNARSKHKSGLPCLGGIPGIGALFSKNEKREEKRNVIIFARPHIILSAEDYQKVTDTQEELFDSLSHTPDFKAGLELVK